VIADTLAADNPVPLPRSLLAAAAKAGRHMRPAHAERLAAAMSRHEGPSGTAYLARVVPAPAFAEHARDLLASWSEHPDVPGALLGAAVASAAYAHDYARHNPKTELVVSGPSSTAVHARRTEQVLLQLASEAQREILIVTFGLYMHPDLRRLLAQAVAAHVEVTVLAEDPSDNPSFRGNPARSLEGTGVRRLRWPSAERPQNGAAMHAKLVIVDRAIALVTSANLTHRAAEDNLEVGVLVRGGDIPARLAEHFDELQRTRVITET
jgi:phosphatidylserine/phosphatidylglycerophosphate/cardiolipin synthase-like enzyme